ncbi:PQQ-like domain-containing protein [Tessaracoccus bendigoensis DSM 12906]|uniref:PQQ-like domain-containing protein n=1 Tax=Tessaracoccus bendigoensis DSM 12906 TaxID=1123357 RepID=A0A1M6NLL0_9ACTN|nr:PQQ-binding-like beta-propeller repeat protein [Tessaracoccus bendigoensis]SHJ96506.1 PQQ-like domain-containing protein [Tessaracoccus bendigoensis DSM 12906]
MATYQHAARPLIVCLATVLLLTGCAAITPRTGSSSHRQDASSQSVATPVPSPEPSVASTVWESEVDVVGDPVVLDDVIVAYLKTAGGVILTGIDPLTGDQLWRRAVSPAGDSWFALDKPAMLVRDGRIWVAAASATGAGRHRVVLMDAMTGKEQDIGSASLWVRRLPHPCPSDEDVFCLQAYLPDADEATAFVLDPGVPALTALPETDRTFQGRHVFTRDGEDSDSVGYLDGTGVVWEQAYTALFGPDAEVDPNNAAWHDSGSSPIIVGEGGLAMPDDPAVGDRSTLAMTSTVGLDRATGKLLWSVPGAERCFEEPEPEPTPDIFIACQVTAGELVITESSETGFSYKVEGREEQLVGIDRATGRILWTQPFVPADEEAPRQFLPNGTRAVIPVEGLGVQVVDLTTGEATPVPPGAELACRTWRDNVTLTRSNGDSFQYVAGHGVNPCDAAGEALTAWSPESLAWGGQRAGELYIVAGEDSLAAYRVS